jgi:hypothetical protein
MFRGIIELVRFRKGLIAKNDLLSYKNYNSTVEYPKENEGDGIYTQSVLKERLETFYGKPIDEIFVEFETEINTGNPVGDEE